MILARLLSKIFKRKEGVILIDSDGQKYICGNPRKENPITVKLLRKDLNMKIVLNPELAFPEAYMRGEIIFENYLNNAQSYQCLFLTFRCVKVKLRFLAKHY